MVVDDNDRAPEGTESAPTVVDRRDQYRRRCRRGDVAGQRKGKCEKSQSHALELCAWSAQRSFAERRAAFTCRARCGCELRVARRLGRRACERPLVRSCKELGRSHLETETFPQPLTVTEHGATAAGGIDVPCRMGCQNAATI